MPLQTMNTTSNSPTLLDTVSKLADLFGNKTTTTSGGTTTQQTLVSPEAAQALINNILGGTSGLSAVASGQKGAGLYNSSTNQLLLNDLISRTAGEVAARGAPTVVSKSPVSVVQQAPLSATTSLLTTGAAYLGNKVIKSSGIGDSVDKGIDSIVKSIFGSSEGGGTNAAGGLTLATGTAPSSGISLVGSGSTSTGLNLTGSSGVGFDAGGFTFGSNLGSSLVTSGTDSAVTAGIDNYDKIDDAAALADAGSAASSGVEAGAEGAAGASYGAAFDGVPVASVAYNVAAGNYGSAAGAAVGGAVGNAIVPVIGGIIGSAIGGALGSDCFITTAVLKSIGEDNDNCKELTVLRRFRDTWLKENHPEDIAQYYREAPELAVKLLEHVYTEELCYFIYTFFLLPAIAHIEKEQYEEAYEVYRYMFNNVKSYLTSETGTVYTVQDYVTNY